MLCADLTATCEVTVEGATGRDVLLGYIAHADREHRHDDITLVAVLDAISHETAVRA
jgi:predicted small metal-binding protein